MNVGGEKADAPRASVPKRMAEDGKANAHQRCGGQLDAVLWGTAQPPWDHNRGLRCA